MQKDFANNSMIDIETRALIDSIGQVEINLKGLGAKYTGEHNFIDKHYANLKNIDPDRHTYEKTGYAARIRHIKSEKENCIEVLVKKALTEYINTNKEHDATITSYFETFPPETDESTLIKIIADMGFPDFIMEIIKSRTIYKLDDTNIYLDNIEGFGPAMEIKNTITDLKDFSKTKSSHKELLKKLAIPESEIITTSYTHMLIDSKIKKDPKIKLPMLESKLKILEKQKADLMFKTHEYATNEGDGWHDNAALDKLYEDVSLLTIMIRNIRQEISELKVV